MGGHVLPCKNLTPELRTLRSLITSSWTNISLSQAIPKPVRVDHFFNGVRVRHAQSASFFLRICSFQPLHLLLWHFLSGASSNFTSCMPRKREYCVWNSLHIAANRILLVPSCPTVVQQLPSLALSAQVRCATLSGRCHTASRRLLASHYWHQTRGASTSILAGWGAGPTAGGCEKPATRHLCLPCSVGPEECWSGPRRLWACWVLTFQEVVRTNYGMHDKLTK